MYFNNKGNTNIDNEFNEKKFKLFRFNFSSKNILLIVVGIILLIFGIVFFVRLGSKNRVTYYLELNGEELVTIYKGNEYIEPGYVGRDSKGNDLTQEVMVDSNVDTSNIGDYQIVYTLHDKSLKRYITVTDKPVGATYIYLKGDNTIYLNIGEEYKEPGYLVIDSIDSSLTDKVVVYNKIDTSKKGTYQVVYTVTNSTGVTTSAKRTVIVMDGNISLSLDNDGYTNKEVGINIYIMDNYFDYLLLPDGNKIKDKSYTYKVSKNGEYKFISYNKTGKGTESSITVSNIDREGPTGTCSGSYGDGKSNIIVNTQDKAGIGKYSINGNSYSSNNITVNKEYSKVTVTVYDKLGNSRDITCNLSKKNIPVPSSSSSSNSSRPGTTKGLQMYFIATGVYDDAIVIKTSDKVILIDSGRWSCRNYVIPYLNKLGIKKINAMIGSHLHFNHIEAQAAILENFEVDKIYYPDDIYTCAKRGSCNTDDQAHIVDALNKYGKKPVIVDAPEKIVIGDIELYFIAPHTIITSGKYPQNANSSIMILKYYNTSFMFTGDSGGENMNVSKLREKANSLGISLDVDMLKYPHHGNAILSDSFLSAIKPEYVIVPNYKSAKYPSSDNINKLSSYGVKMYRQSDSSTGNIYLYSDGNTVSVTDNYN